MADTSESKAVRTRFAPSPTGSLHLGTARTALYNWAFARGRGGALVMRLEDTDRERSTAESEKSLLEDLGWLGIEWDEGPFRQSERESRYAVVIDELLAAGRAYRCRCTREELEERRKATIAAGGKWTYDGRCRELALGPDCGPHTVRLGLAESGALDWDDLVFGPSGQDASEIGDRIIRRADGTSLYHLSVVVDDLDMGISHVIRGADHQPNTPFQIALYRALDREPPRFAHVPLILGPGGKKLSKRHEATSIEHFREQGFLAPALRNWIVRLGWSHGDQEIFSRDEIAELFDLEHVGRSGAQADNEKLEWLNHEYIEKLPSDELLEEVEPFLARALDREVPLDDPGLVRLVDLNRQRSKTLVELAEKTRWLPGPVAFDEKAARKHLSVESAALLGELASSLEALDDWSETSLEAPFEALCAAHGIKMGKIAQPLRVALTGGTASPGIYETLAVVGRERSLERIAAATEIARRG